MALIECREMDGGFVERYGSGLKESFSEDAFVIENDEFNKTLDETNVLVEVISEAIAEDGVPYVESLSESLGLNVNELYEEVLQEILHNVGGDKVCSDQKSMIAFAREAFNIDQETHDFIYRSVKEKEASKIMLNIEIIEGKNLEPKVPNGLSNPFCTLNLLSKPQYKYNTSIKIQTLLPVWKEHFSLPVENPSTDILCVEMWDFRPKETAKEKVSKNGETKGLKGIKKFMKEISMYSKHCRYVMIGSTLIPLKTIPSLGQKDWHNLESKGKRQGCLLVKMSFGKEKHKQISTQEHRNLLRVLLNHQISLQKAEMHSWTGEFSPESSLLIQQHVRQSNISLVEEILGQWIEFINIHTQNPVINIKVFSDILDDLIESVKVGQLSSDELNMFWHSAKKILPFCFNVIRTMRKTPDVGDERLIDQVEYVLNVFRQLQSLTVPNDVDLFSLNVYDWLSSSDHARDIRSTLQDTIIQSAMDCHAHIVKINKPQQYTEEKEEDEIKVQLKVINFLKLDLQKAVEFHDSFFIKKMQLPYASILFSVYDRKIAEMCEPLIDQVCVKMRQINFDENCQFDIDNDPLAMGTSLFNLYIEIQRFAELGNNNAKFNAKTSRTANYYLWFQQSVARWLDITAYKVMRCTERAVDLDCLVKVHSSLEYSSSAVDTLAIFYQIKSFWQELAWPDVEGSYSFMAKIIDDICKYSLHYSDKMSSKVSRTAIKNQTFQVTKEWCLAINNIDYIKRSIHTFVNDLGLTELMESLAHCKSDVEVNNCKKTLELVMDNAIDIVNHKIVKLLQVIVDKMTPNITKLLIEAGETFHANNKHLENLIQYLDESLCTLKDELDKEHFQVILEYLVEEIFDVTFNLIDQHLEQKKPPAFFRNLRVIFQKLFEFLINDNETEYVRKTIQKLESTLHLHVMDTEDLVYEYCSERLRSQKEIKEANQGVLTVKLLFINDVLKIDILNAHCLRSMDYNGFSDPFVKIRLIPQNKFPNIIKVKTAVQKKTLSPLFDEFFEIPLTAEQRAEENAIVMFIIKDQDFMGLRNEFISEAFMHFKDIPHAREEDDLTCSPQIKLKMTVPKSLDSKILEVLEGRTNDKLARDFIKQVKVKIAASIPRVKKN